MISKVASQNPSIVSFMEILMELVLRSLDMVMVALLASGDGKDRELFVRFSVILLSVTSHLSLLASLGHAPPLALL